MAFPTMIGYIQPFHSCLMAAKYDFMSEHIKTGSFIYLNLPNGQNVEANNVKTERFMRSYGDEPYHSNFQKERTNNLKTHTFVIRA